MVDGRQSWRCIKRNKCPGRLYTINDAFHCLGKLHGHPADAFNTIVDNIPKTLEVDPLLGYFEKTWIVGLSGRRARFPPESWNQCDRVETDLNRTNNFCESFNKTFAEVVGHSNPTIFNFLSAVQLEQASTESKICCYRHSILY